MRFTTALALSLASILAFCGCAADPVSKEGPAPFAALSDEPAVVCTTGWNSKPFAEAPGEFHFAVMADRTGSMRPGVFRDAAAKVNTLRPDFVMCVGDLIEGYTDEETELAGEWDEFAGILDALDMPFFGCVGNHDVSNEMMTSYVEKRFGPLYYSFVYDNALFVVLNSQDDPAREDAYRSGLGTEQVEFVRRTLAKHAGVIWTFVFMHQPLFDAAAYAEAPGWSEVQGMLSQRPHTVFAGHWHEYARHDVGGHSYYRLGTTGGASELTGAETGKLDHVMWVSVTARGPVIANLAVEGILPDDFSTADTTVAFGSIIEGTLVKPSSIVTEASTFTSAVTQIELRNQTAFPLTVKAAFEPNGVLTAEPGEIEAAVAPHSSRSIDLAIAAAEPADPEALEPVDYNWSASYEVPGREPIAGTGAGQLMVEGIHSCPRSAAPVEVDGDLSEWGELAVPFSRPMQFVRNESLWNGPEDCCAQMAVSYDEDYLYLAVATKDDIPMVGLPEHQVRQEDAVTIVIDARPAGARGSFSEGWADYVAFVLSPGAKAGETRLGEPLEEGAFAAAALTEGGYNAEIAIPHAILDKAAGGPWADFRLNVRLHDLDTSQWDNTMFWWRPSWDGANDYEGSGTFRRD